MSKKSYARLADTDATTVEHAREMGLSDDEYARAREVLGRVPNKLELGCFSAMWSEHCSYKSSRVHLKGLPTTTPAQGFPLHLAPKGVLIGPGENAGVVDIGDGLAVAFKVESHNHPSYIEPYQGAATGVGGILRDVFTMGARPIAAMNLLRFGQPSHKKTPALLRGVVKGIGGYGNCFGVPTVYSHTTFAAPYDGNILVNAFALGVLAHDGVFLGRAEGAGNPVMYVGAKTGRDGIHGATMASDSFSEEKEQERPTVQVGDPFKEKLLMEACMEAFVAHVLVGIQDMGAAGLTSSSFEMASRAGSGVVIDLDKVPQRETGMTGYELMLSESQERMLLVAERGKEDAVKRIFEKWDLDCVEIGTVTTDGFVRLRMAGKELAVLPARELADEAPRYSRPFAPRDQKPVDETPALKRDLAGLLHDVIVSPALADPAWIYQRYDREVGTGTLLDGTEAPAALVSIPAVSSPSSGVVHTKRGVAMSLVCNGALCEAEPRQGAMRAVAEGVLRAACVGAFPIGATDCLNYGNPQKPDIMWQLKEGIEGIGEACRALSVPVVSGNVSLYNQTDEQAVYPTPTVGVVGVVEDWAKIVPRRAVQGGQVLVRIGKAGASLLGSLALSRTLQDRPSGAVAVDLASFGAVAAVVRGLVVDGKAVRAWPVADGGLCGAAFVLARVEGLGATLTVKTTHELFGEDAAAALLVVDKRDEAAVLDAARAARVPADVVGVLGGDRFAVSCGPTRIDLSLRALVDENRAFVPRSAGQPGQGAA